MRTSHPKQKSTLLIASVALAIGGGALLLSPMMGTTSGVAHAQQQGAGGPGGSAGSQGLQGRPAGGQRADSPSRGRSESPLADEVLRGPRRGLFTPTHDDGEDDSDRPDWAGRDRTVDPGRMGRSGTDTRRGDLFGDLMVILRDDNGVPILDENGHVQPCLDLACTEVIQLTEDGEVPSEYTDQVLEVEMGRLNVSRSPSRVLEAQLTSLLTAVDGMEITADNILEWTDESGRLYDQITGGYIDSPLQNLALYQALLVASAKEPVDGFYEISVSGIDHGTPYELTLKVAPDVLGTLAASAFAAGADKTSAITVDQVVNISIFLGVFDQLQALVADNTYDRDARFDQDVTILVYDADRDVYVPTIVNLLEAVTWDEVPIIEDNGVGIDTFTQNVTDAVRVIQFVHDYGLEF